MKMWKILLSLGSHSSSYFNCISEEKKKKARMHHLGINKEKTAEIVDYIKKWYRYKLMKQVHVHFSYILPSLSINQIFENRFNNHGEQYVVEWKTYSKQHSTLFVFLASFFFFIIFVFLIYFLLFNWKCTPISLICVLEIGHTISVYHHSQGNNK